MSGTHFPKDDIHCTWGMYAHLVKGQVMGSYLHVLLDRLLTV